MPPAPPAAPAAPKPPPPPAAPAVAPDARPGAAGRVAGRNERVLVYVPAAGDRIDAVAERTLGDAGRAWQIAAANGDRWELESGQPIAVPLLAPAAHGVSANGVQTVPVLCYHRFGSGHSKMTMAPERFEAQLEWLARNHYRVLRLADLQAFLDGRTAPPPRSVVLTVDDGYDSFHRLAFPLLRKYKVPATLFVYADIIGARDGLSWAQLREMAESGLVDIQAHSKTHRNLTEQRPDESDAAYRQAIALELRAPRQLLERHLAAAGVKVRHFAYPYGDGNDVVLEVLQGEDYDLAFTVRAGGNPAFASPRLLRRTMIYGDHDLEDFKARLQTSRSLARP